MLLNLSCGEPPETAAAHFGSQTPTEALMYMHLSSGQKYNSLLHFGELHMVALTSALAPLLVPPSIHMTTTTVSRPEWAVVAFFSQKHFKLIFHFIYSFKHALALCMCPEPQLAHFHCCVTHLFPFNLVRLQILHINPSVCALAWSLSY